MLKDKILITGANGMLGKAAIEILSKRFEVIATDYAEDREPFMEYLDVRNIEDFEKIINKNLNYPITKIFHLAALTSLEYCENNQEEAWDTNAFGVENAAVIAKKYDCEIIYISTAGIFDTVDQEFFTEYDKPTPKSVYGKSKYYGEKIVQQITSKHYVFRAGWMMGGEQKDKKFVKLILDQIKNDTKTIYAVDDKLGTPTYTYDFINNMLGVIDKQYYGLYNQVCKGDCSRYDVAKEIVNYLKLDIPVEKVSSDYFKQSFWAPRPYSEKLINQKLEKRKLNNMRDWKVCLTEYLNKIHGEHYV